MNRALIRLCALILMALILVSASLQRNPVIVRIIPDGDLVYPVTNLRIDNFNNLDGQELYRHLTDFMYAAFSDSLSVTFQNFDFKYMSAEELAVIAHDHMFVNKGHFPINAKGSIVSKGHVHVSLYLTLHEPTDEHLLLPQCKSAHEKSNLSVCSNEFDRIKQFLVKTFVLPETHQMLQSPSHITSSELEESNWNLAFAAFSKLAYLSRSLRELKVVEKESYDRLFATSPKLCLGMSTELANHMESICDRVSAKNAKSLAKKFEAVSKSIQEEYAATCDSLRSKEIECFDLNTECILKESVIKNMSRLLKLSSEAEAGLHEKLKEKDSENKLLLAATEENSERLNLLEQENQSKFLLLEQSRKDISKLKEKRVKSKRAVSSYRSGLQAKETELSQKRSECSRLQENIEKLTIQFKDAKMSEENLKAKLDVAQTETALLQTDSMVKDSKLNELESDLKTLSEKLAQATSDLDAAKLEAMSVSEESKTILSRQKCLINQLGTAAAHSICFTNFLDRPETEEDIAKMMQFTHAKARFEEIQDPEEYSERNLGPKETSFNRTLWLETYFGEGYRIRNWLATVKSGDWRDNFGFEACYTGFTDDMSEEKIKRKLVKMKKEIVRLDARVRTVIHELLEECTAFTNLEPVSKFVAAAHEVSGSSLDIALYIAARDAIISAKANPKVIEEQHETS